MEAEPSIADITARTFALNRGRQLSWKQWCWLCESGASPLPSWPKLLQTRTFFLVQLISVTVIFDLQILSVE